MLPPSGVRRLVFVPLVMVIAAALTVLAPPLALFSAAFAAIKKSQTGRAHRMRTLRVVCFALAWFLGETAALTVSGCLWIVSGFGGRLDTEPYRSRNYAVMRWLLDLIYRAAERTCGLSVHVAGPPGEPQDAASRPIIVLSRHAGPGDSLLVVHHLLTACGRRPRLVMKAALQLDPSLDVLANRLPNAFVQHHRRTRSSTGPRHHTEQIRRLATGLDEQSALVIFPEGANWTPLRWRRGIARLRRRGLPDLAERAAAMPNVLPPRTTGALVALAACPAADVIFVAHAGLDTLVSVRDVWQSLSADVTVCARWWRVPADEVPRTAGQQAQVDWLYDWWRRIDAWISDQHARDQDIYPERRAAGSPADALSRGRASRRHTFCHRRVRHCGHADLERFRSRPGRGAPRSSVDARRPSVPFRSGEPQPVGGVPRCGRSLDTCRAAGRQPAG
jgi:1-acyl-sn-glycerol-3-phosphate acyltransferase